MLALHEERIHTKNTISFPFVYTKMYSKRTTFYMLSYVLYAHFQEKKGGKPKTTKPFPGIPGKYEKYLLKKMVLIFDRIGSDRIGKLKNILNIIRYSVHSHPAIHLGWHFLRSLVCLMANSICILSTGISSFDEVFWASVLNNLYWNLNQIRIAEIF